MCGCVWYVSEREKKIDKERSRDRHRESKYYNPVSWKLVIPHIHYNPPNSHSEAIDLQTIFTDTPQKQMTYLENLLWLQCTSTYITSFDRYNRHFITQEDTHSPVNSMRKEVFSKCLKKKVTAETYYKSRTMEKSKTLTENV